MSKYYATTIEEFHVGFGYEIHRGYSEKEDRGGVIEMSNKFVNTIMTNETGFGYIQGCIDDKFLRVKYLDREDAESLGFVKWPDDDIYDLGKFQLHLGRYTDPYKVEIYDDNSEYCFVGTIKNKSELKKVLKMIGYEF